MNIFAQAGHQTGDKIVSGLEEGVLDGVIFNARNADPQKIAEIVAGAKGANADAEILFDPEFYATRLIELQTASLVRWKNGITSYLIAAGTWFGRKLLKKYWECSKRSLGIDVRHTLRRTFTFRSHSTRWKRALR